MISQLKKINFQAAKKDSAKGSEPLWAIWETVGSARPKRLSMALSWGDSEFGLVLYMFLVQEFRKAPSIKRFLFIYERFFAGSIHLMEKTIEAYKTNRQPKVSSDVYKETPDGIELSINGTRNFWHLKMLAKAKAIIDALVEDAAKKSLFKRSVKTDHIVIPGHIFDEITYEMIFKPGRDLIREHYGKPYASEGGLAEHVWQVAQMKMGKDPYFQKSLQQVQGKLKKNLESDGFDTKILGINDMHICVT